MQKQNTAHWATCCIHITIFTGAFSHEFHYGITALGERAHLLQGYSSPDPDTSGWPPKSYWDIFFPTIRLW